MTDQVWSDGDHKIKWQVYFLTLMETSVSTILMVKVLNVCWLVRATGNSTQSHGRCHIVIFSARCFCFVSGKTPKLTLKSSFYLKVEFLQAIQNTTPRKQTMTWNVTSRNYEKLLLKNTSILIWNPQNVTLSDCCCGQTRLALIQHFKKEKEKEEKSFVHYLGNVRTLLPGGPGTPASPDGPAGP